MYGRCLTVLSGVDDLEMSDFVVFFGIFVVLLIFVTIIRVGINRSIEQDNESQPVRENFGTILDMQKLNGNVVYAAPTIWVLFELDDGSRHRFMVKVDNCFAVGDFGKLRWQGNRILAFDRSAKPISKPVEQYAKAEAEERETVYGLPSKTESDMIICPACNTAQRGNRTVCYACGCVFAEAPKKTTEAKTTESTVQMFCHKCGHKQPYGEGTCSQCGTKLADPG